MSDTGSLIVLLGFDAEKMPRAARLRPADEVAASKAAGLMGLRIAYAKSEAAIGLARKLPEAKLLASGKGTIPRVKPDTYALLVKELEFKGPAPTATPAAGETKPDPAISAAAAALWSRIKVGSIVLVFENSDPKLPGWYDCVVLAVENGENLKVRWRDYPGFRPFIVKRSAVGLARPNGRPGL
jgi:hypothetical protein